MRTHLEQTSRNLRRIPKVTDFTKEELEQAELLLRHIEQFESPRKEFELVKWVVNNDANNKPSSKAA